MKSIIFALDLKNPNSLNNISSQNWIYEFKKDILPAFAIAYVVFSRNGILDYDCIKINNDLITLNYDTRMHENESVHILVYYNGIRDYKLLFPQILSSNEPLATRLGLFYEEAEKSFENTSWLSYVLNCGAIFEGLLLHKLNAKKKLILKY